MNSSAVAVSLINFLGFAFGTALYAVLLGTVARNPVRVRQNGEESKLVIDRILLATAILGLLWNIGNLSELVWRDYWSGQPSAWLSAIAYTALGFLPALIIHSKWKAKEDGSNSGVKYLTLTAYFLGAAAGLLHFQSIFSFNSSPSIFALQILTVGYLVILAALFWTQRRDRDIGRKGVLMAALAVFAVSALHLSRPHTESGTIFIELVGHQASLPLAFVILYQDFRFAFADVFLKRALSLIFLTAFVLCSYILFVIPLLAMHENHQQPDAQSIAVMIVFGMAGAFVFPKLNQFAAWIVDKVLLRRVPFGQLQTEIMNRISTLAPVATVLNEVKERLAAALTAKTATYDEAFRNSENLSVQMTLINLEANEVKITIPTVDEPHYKIALGDFSGGRRLLSGELEMLEAVAMHTARRIDALRVTHERCERELREQEFSKLATEAELRVLRAQINPHFLFNALTTIGYLIGTAPERAVQTLLQLTGLLRGSLRSTGEFQTLGEELKLIRAYLEIEKARFEERLNVEINVEDEFLAFRIPSLILQPLVENAVKHGISPIKKGGTVSIEARRENGYFILQVSDTGAGISAEELLLKRENRVGLNNVEERLRLHYNGAAGLTIERLESGGTIVRIEFDLSKTHPLKTFQSVSATIGKQAERAFL